MEGAGESGGCQEEGVLNEDGEEGDCWGTGDQSEPSDIRRLGDSAKWKVIDNVSVMSVNSSAFRYAVIGVEIVRARVQTYILE